MNVGDIVRIIPGFENPGAEGLLGVVVKTDKSLEVTSHCVKVFWPHKTGMPRISMLELVSESR
jgi:hypothetical protein